MGSEDPQKPMRRNGFSFDSLTGFFSQGGRHRPSIDMDFADGPMDLDDEATSVKAMSESHYSKDDVDYNQPSLQRTSTPAIRYAYPSVQPPPSAAAGAERKGTVPSTSDALKNDNVPVRRSSTGDKPRGHNTPAKSNFILNWLAYQPMSPCQVINEDIETCSSPDRDSAPPTFVPTTSAGVSQTSRPITDAVLKMDPSIRLPPKEPQRKTSILRDMNALTPSNW